MFLLDIYIDARLYLQPKKSKMTQNFEGTLIKYLIKKVWVFVFWIIYINFICSKKSGPKMIF
jgi:hypothetical protein